MKKVLIFSLTILMLIYSAVWSYQQDDIAAESQTPLNLMGQGAILIDQDRGTAIFSKNPDGRLYPASTTKILTALVVIENTDPDEIVTVGNEINLLLPLSSTAGLYVGEKIAVRDLLYGLLLPSGSDSAYTLAAYLGRKTNRGKFADPQQAVAAFSELMNNRAKKAGAKNSNFVNPDGYTDENHFSTARDLALISREAMRKPFFREVVGTEVYQKPKSTGAAGGLAAGDVAAANVWENTNALLDQKSPYFFPGVTGIKTGYTSAAGYCLVSSASRDGLNLIAVVLNSTQTGALTDSRQLLTYGFNNYKPPGLIYGFNNDKPSFVYISLLFIAALAALTWKLSPAYYNRLAKSLAIILNKIRARSKIR